VHSQDCNCMDIVHSLARFRARIFSACSTGPRDLAVASLSER
jgi:hypothetical protein